MTRKERIEQLIQQALSNAKVIVTNESHQHHVPEGSETHFHLVVISDHFQNLQRLQRHRQINHILQKEFDSGLHALSLHLYTPMEWEKTQSAPTSPNCKGGFDKP